ncbi:WXG100 family type VII secretion target [Floccifex sp.]|uniref:WXG100 family type VII secretion target n=1 Tax=Floccifex sp. TaxID=2815810 RepID=UPI0029FF4F29|nr:WXG100 family type VII secretion target [Floccifex sp.]MDD7280859.1 WXG100 family type VII secretion target [Erysipelotrichaceae bacterium]MDY2958323.1 WXG100 family type VII secretion target [Floccifex sp.]
MNIKVNYEDLLQQAKYLQMKADEYKQIVDTMNQKIHAMYAIWQGEDHLVFVSKFDELYPRLNQMNQVINEYATLLQKSAYMYQSLQQDRIAKAKQLA